MKLFFTLYSSPILRESLDPYYLISICVCLKIDECEFPNIYACYGDCKNTAGSFICMCSTGYTGNASIPNGCTGTAATTFTLVIALDVSDCSHCVYIFFVN